MNIEIVSGSPRKESITFRIALFLQEYFFEKAHHSVNIIDVREWDLPLLQQETFANAESVTEVLLPLAKRVFNAHAFILISPEYNGSYTSALKNLFDHFPKQHHKAFGIVTASTGSLGGIRASLQLQLLVNALFGIASPYMLITPFTEKKFDDSGKLIDTNFEKNIELFSNEFLWLAESLASELHALH